MLPRQFHRLAPIDGLADDLMTGFFEHFTQIHADDGFIICNDNP